MKRMSCLIGWVWVASLVVGAAGGCKPEKAQTGPGDAVGMTPKSANSKMDKGDKSLPPGGSVADRLDRFYPPVMGNFYKTGVQRYDATGDNASVTYNHFRYGGETAIVFTAYVYPMEKDSKSLDDALDGAVKEFKSAHKSAKAVGPAEDVVTRQGGQTYTGRKVTYRYEDAFGSGERRPLLTEIHVFRKGDRVVKYLVSYPASDTAEVAGPLSAFLSAFPWPSTI
jgi:hypothetical protein